MEISFLVLTVRTKAHECITNEKVHFCASARMQMKI